MVQSIIHWCLPQLSVIPIFAACMTLLQLGSTVSDNNLICHPLTQRQQHRKLLWQSLTQYHVGHLGDSAVKSLLSGSAQSLDLIRHILLLQHKPTQAEILVCNNCRSLLQKGSIDLHRMLRFVNQAAEITAPLPPMQTLSTPQQHTRCTSA